MKKKVRQILTNKKFNSMLKECLIKEADEIEKALEVDHRLDGIEAPADMLDSITTSLKNQGLWKDGE